MEAGAAPRTLASPNTVKNLLASAGIHPNRSLGQNFLVDANILRIITDAADLSPFDTVIEVGAGLGALTQALVEQCGKVYALESDRRLMRILARELSYARNLVLVEADAARYDFEQLWEAEPPDDVKMVSNLPYRIAASLVVGCLKRYPWISRYTIMVQREVAERLLCEPGCRDYSSASVKAQVLARVRRVANVSRNSFYPRPRVDSTILNLERRPESELVEEFGADGMGRFDRVVTAAFSQRRKKLANALAASHDLPADGEVVRHALQRIGRDPSVRAEDLSPEEFVDLSEMLRG